MNHSFILPMPDYKVKGVEKGIRYKTADLSEKRSAA
jgi:hypothetical protein